jgi:CheY-like chemotaxis protein
VRPWAALRCAAFEAERGRLSVMTARMVKVLIVDDEPTTRFVIRRFVQDLGHITIEASDGLRAWHILNDNQDIDLMITDLMMPEKSGEELIRQVRSSETLRMLRVLVITSKCEPDVLRHLADLGASGFVRKPITRHLNTVIQRVLAPGELPHPTKLL